jgi:hypothetical protein
MRQNSLLSTRDRERRGVSKHIFWYDLGDPVDDEPIQALTAG